MTHQHGTLTERVVEMLNEQPSLPKEVVDALRLAEIYDDFRPEEFSRPITDSFQIFRPFDLASVFSPDHYS